MKSADLNFYRPTQALFSFISPFRLIGRQTDCISRRKKSHGNFSAAWGCGFCTIFLHNDKETSVNTVVFIKFLKSQGRNRTVNTD